MCAFLSKKKYQSTVVFRHRKENLKKCTLSGLEKREDFIFYRYPTESVPELFNYILLKVDAPPLTEKDQESGLLILDATWRYALKMSEFIESKQSFIFRSIPGNWKTAYPRRQLDCPDPERGLASIEAIYAAYHLLGRDTTGLLDGYYWKNQFLERNQTFFIN